MTYVHNKINFMKLYILLLLGLSLNLAGAFQKCADANCDACQVSKDACQTCADGFLLENEKCTPCTKGCTTCARNNRQLECSVCNTADGFELGSDKKCFKCNRICATCTGTPDNCATCDQGYEKVATTAGFTCRAKSDCKVEGCDTCVNGN